MTLRFAILGLLCHEDLSGYEITKRFASTVVYFWNARSQQIYPELARLEAEGFITGRQVEQVGRPDKRVYSITEQGRAALIAWAVTPSPLTFVKDEFMVKVYAYGMVDPDAALEAIRQHRVQHQERLTEFRTFEDWFQRHQTDGSDTDAMLGAHMALRGGTRIEEAVLAWLEEAEQMLRDHAQQKSARPPAVPRA